MDDFSNYFKNMMEQLMKGGAGQVHFDINAANSPEGILKMFLGGNENTEKLAVRRLELEELEQYQALLRKKSEIQSQFKRLMAQQKVLEGEMDLFWQDLKDKTNLDIDHNRLSIDEENGFLFQEVKIDEVNKEEE